MADNGGGGKHWSRDRAKAQIPGLRERKGG
jgi:hypothetical protein